MLKNTQKMVAFEKQMIIKNTLQELANKAVLIARAMRTVECPWRGDQHRQHQCLQIRLMINWAAPPTLLKCIQDRGSERRWLQGLVGWCVVFEEQSPAMFVVSTALREQNRETRRGAGRNIFFGKGECERVGQGAVVGKRGNCRTQPTPPRAPAHRVEIKQDITSLVPAQLVGCSGRECVRLGLGEIK